MLIMVEKGIRGEICHAIYQYGKASNKYRKQYDRNKGLPYLNYRNVNNLCRWTISQILPINNLE